MKRWGRDLEKRRRKKNMERRERERRESKEVRERGLKCAQNEVPNVYNKSLKDPRVRNGTTHQNGVISVIGR